VLWGINGFAQAFMWPPLVRIMATIFTPTDYKRASAIVSWGSSIGTMIVYFASFVLIQITKAYNTVFLFSAIIGFIMIFVWLKFCPRVEIKKATTTESEIKSETQTAKIQFPIVFFFIMLAVVLQGMLRDGVTTWMPTYIDEVYHLGDTAILSGVILPIFSILCISATSWLYKKIPNPVTCSSIMFGIGAVASVVLVFVPSNNAVMSIPFR
jgi:OPA family glycerol-3-phosphate transporter-like MFS transporter